MKKRMTIEISKKMNQHMDNIISSGECSTKVGIIRNALALYVYAMKESDKGHTLAITKNGKIIKDIVLSK